MSYVPGYKYDFFISYAHVDNDPMPSASRGWVDDFVKILTTGTGLAGELGRRDAFSFYWDNQSLRINHEFNHRIPEEVKQSALFLVILSPGYAASEFCCKELETFVQTIGGTSERLFVVQMKPLDDITHKVPSHLLGRLACKFFEYDKDNKAHTLGWPLPHHERPEDRPYYQKIGDLQTDMARKLIELKNDRPVSRGPAVLLTEVTEFLDPHRDKLARILDQLGIQILPAGSYYGLTRSDYERKFLEDLANSVAVVQLLGPEVGKRPEAAPLGFPYLQYDLARRHPRLTDGRERPILQWRDPDRMDVKSVEPEEYGLLLDQVEAMPLKDFADKVVRVIQQPQRPADAGASPVNSLIYVNCAPIDKDSADEIGKRLAGFHWKRPYYDRKPKSGELRETIENDLLTCNALFLVYGRTRPKWVRRQLELYWDQVASQRREKGEPAVRAIVNAGDGPKEPIGMGLPGWDTIGIDDIPGILKGIASPAGGTANA